MHREFSSKHGWTRPESNEYFPPELLQDRSELFDPDTKLILAEENLQLKSKIYQLEKKVKAYKDERYKQAGIDLKNITALNEVQNGIRYFLIVL